MTLKADLRTLLLADATIAGLIGTHEKSGDACIRPERLFEKDRLPAIEMHTEKDAAVNDLTGAGRERNVQMVLSCIGIRQSDAEGLAAEVRRVLEPFVGATTTGSLGGIWWIAERGAWAPYGDGTDDGEFVQECTLKLWYTPN